MYEDHNGHTVIKGLKSNISSATSNNEYLTLSERTFLVLFVIRETF